MRALYEVGWDISYIRGWRFVDVFQVGMLEHCSLCICVLCIWQSLGSLTLVDKLTTGVLTILSVGATNVQCSV